MEEEAEGEDKNKESLIFNLPLCFLPHLFLLLHPHFLLMFDNFPPIHRERRWLDSALRDEAGDFSRQTGSGSSDRAAAAASQEEKKVNAASAAAAAAAATPASPLQFGEEVQFLNEKVYSGALWSERETK